MAPAPNKPGALLLELDRASTIELDGQVIAQQSRGGTYEVKPGHHVVRVTPPDRSPVERAFDLGPGETSAISIDFPTTATPGSDTPPPPPSAPSPPPPP